MAGAYAGYELKPVIAPLKVGSDRSGLEQVTGYIDDWLNSGQYERLVIGHEPTGVYHEAWARALAERYKAYRNGQRQPLVEYCFVNPLVSKRRREQLAKGRKRKTDPADLKAIAHCLRDGEAQAAFLPSREALAFQLWAEAYRQNRRERWHLGIRLLSQLDRLWPGLVVNLKRFRQAHPELEAPVPLVLSEPLQRQRLRVLLQHCPNPHHFRALGPEGIQAFYRQHLGRCGSALAKLAFQIVSQAVLPPADLAELLADPLQADFERYLALEKHFEQLSQQAEQLVPASPAQVLTTIPGVSPVLAARYLAHLGHPQRFTQPEQIWAFAGFDPVSQESGDFRRVGKISRKGEAALRDTLYLIGFHTLQQIPALAQLHQRAKARGKGRVGAILHVAHKVNRLCHHLLYHQQPFDPKRLR